MEARAAVAKDRDCLTILHTNDFHNHLTEAQAQRLRLLHDSIPGDHLMVDAGDAVGAGNITYRPAGEPILDSMAEAGYDAMTVGNREFHFSRVGFTSKLSRASFPVLSANIYPSRTFQQDRTVSAIQNDEEVDTSVEPNGVEKADMPVVPYIYRELPGGWRVVVFGITVPMITEKMLSRKVSSYVFDDPLQTAARLVPELRERYAPDLLIALTHIGIKKDHLLAETVPGIDLIIGGHTHVVLEQGERVGETLIVQAGSFGRFVGRVIACKDHSEGGVSLRASLETL